MHTLHLLPASQLKNYILNMPSLSYSLLAISGVPLVNPGDDLTTIILDSLTKNNIALDDNDVLVVAQKIVSKAEGQLVNLDEVSPGPEALKLAEDIDKDPRLVELVLSESVRIVRTKPGVLVVEHHSGIVMANAGIDHSNVNDAQDAAYVTLLPRDANKSAKELCEALSNSTGKKIAVIINDSVGRPWRKGTVGIAIGSAGITPLVDLRGNKDLFGNVLQVSETADADSLASAACLLMGEGADASPLVLIRGHTLVENNEDTRVLIRDAENDMFR